MGVFSKLKGIFYDEVVVDEDDNDTQEEEISKVNKILKRDKKEKEKEVDEPIIEEINYRTIDFEPTKEEEEEVKEPEKKESTFSERDLFRSEKTFNFVDWDDEDEVQEPPKRNVLNEQNRSVKTESVSVTDNTPKVFKPTPVISPIWGVMNKDYKVEEMKEKPVTTETQLNSAVTSYDTVRRKAYGTLEDELEDTLNSMNKLSTETIKKEVNKVDKDVELLEQKTSKIEDLINKIEEETENMDKELSVGELEDRVELENFEEEEEPKKEEVKEEKTVSDNTLEHDLFNLIDSMYDDKED